MTETTSPNPSAEPTQDAEETVSTAPESDMAGSEQQEAAEGTLSPEQQKIAELEQQLEEMKAQALRAMAETENMRKRTEREISDAKKFALSGFAKDLLGVADNLERALTAIPSDQIDSLDSTAKALIDGVKMTSTDLTSVFSKAGIVEVEAMGKAMDPNLHQAIVEIPDETQEPGTIVQVMQSGYTLNGRLLRPAMVGVSKK